MLVIYISIDKENKIYGYKKVDDFIKKGGLFK